MRLPRLVSGLGAALAVVGAVSAQEWRTAFSATWAENLSRTSFAPDRQNAAVYDGAVDAVWHRQLAPNWLAQLQGEAGFEQVPVFPGLDGIHLGARLDVRRKFGLGPFAPALDVWGQAARYDLHERDRSAWRVDGGLSLSQRLTETWRASVSGQWNEDYARGHIFDIVNRRISLETTWQALERIQLSAGASRLWGQLTANANEFVYYSALGGGFGPKVAHYYGTIPWAESTAFGDDWVAYRIDCRADLCWLGASIALGENTSLSPRYESARVVNRADVTYRSAFWSLSLVHRF